MKLVAFEPHDGLTFRHGAGADGSNTMRTLPFPWPSSTTGALRTAMGTNEAGAFTATAKDARSWACLGPLLLRRPTARPDWDLVADLCVPAPADAVLFGATPALRRRAQRPIPLRDGEMTDLGAELGLVGLGGEAPREKPAQGPAFWRWKALDAWLTDPTDGPMPEDAGVPALPIERRTHVALQADQRVGKDGDLFSAEVLRFRDHRYDHALLCGIDAGARVPRIQRVTLGGERRLSSVRPLGATLPPAPERRSSRLRVVLLTPALFDAGALPRAIEGARVVAACVGRPISISGWNFETGKPKPTRRAAPAGSVYWVDLPVGVEPTAWTRSVWMKAISSDEQDRRDGFGLCVVGEA